MLTLHRSGPLHGVLTVPGDKSISHRAVMLGSLAEGVTEVTHFLRGADCLSTIGCFRSLGVPIDITPERIIIHGRGLHGLTPPDGVLDTGNSGTTTRLIAGILAAQPFTTTLTGDASIRKRPMKRIMEPLSLMGADITSLNHNGCAPLLIKGGPLAGIHYISPVASAQVKSSLLLAGLYAEGVTRVTEPVLSRNHSELMLRAFGADVTSSAGDPLKPTGREGVTVSIAPAPKLSGRNISVPGDISSAAYFIAAALLVPGSEVRINNVGVNPTRAGILEVIRAMGGKVDILREYGEEEPAADLLVSAGSLHGTTISGGLIPTLIDELPVIAVLASAAQGATVIKDAAELKVKESNRIDAIVDNLSAMGCDIEATPDGMIIEGGRPLHGAVIKTQSDHRIAMSFAVAALLADGDTVLTDSECVDISYPEFYRDLTGLTG